MITRVVAVLRHHFPLLPLKLRQAGMAEEPEEFLRKTLIVSIYMAFTLTIVVGLVIHLMEGSFALLIFIFPLLYGMVVMYMMNSPEVYIKKRQREIDREIVFMGRYLILEIEAGIPVYNAMKNIAATYEHTGKFFREIIDWVDMGTPIEDALNEALLTCPSPSMVRILWQILNATKTGGDIKISLSNVLDQITREQMILLKEYGKKLNPLAMMYMVMAVIFPSLGVTMLVIMASFLSLNLDFTALLVLAGMIAFMQYMFFNIIKSQRPAVDL